MKSDGKEEDIALCRRCGRKLKSEESRKRGMGDTCYKKSTREGCHKKLFNTLQN